MRIWDIDPGYLNRGSLLAEHRELHALYNVLTQGKQGFETQPELIRWRTYIPALIARHQKLVAEMNLRQMGHHSPLPLDDAPELVWPESYVTAPEQQLEILASRYLDKPPGRIPFPKNMTDLWAQHKYSVMARDPHRAKEIGRQIAKKAISIQELHLFLVENLRIKPLHGRLVNAVEHMWGYVKIHHSNPSQVQSKGLADFFKTTQTLVIQHQPTYLIHSTALGELGAYID